MADRKGKKRVFVSISSSSEQEEEEEEDSDSESESESESDDSDEEECEHSGDSTSCGEWSDEEGDESEDDDEESSDPDDDESICDRVIRLLQVRSNLQGLTLTDCKAYLRNHGLRVTGTKEECVMRIKEHWRIKDGNGEALYPRSSFVINCTGDVCQGDVVLFTQKVYEKFDKVTRSGCPLGKRTVAGRIVKESYGAAKQQHTFTVEVLWSKGVKKLPPLSPLLVKGRNLYKLKTQRQCWKREAERSKVLAEKHKRGAAARLVRATRIMKKATRIMKKQSKSGSMERGSKRQKQVHHARPSQIKQPTVPERRKSVQKHGKASKRNVKSNIPSQRAPPVGKVNSNQTTKSRAPSSSRSHQNPTHMYGNIVPQNFHQSQPQLEFHHHSASYSFPRPDLGSTFNMRLPPFRAYDYSFVAHSSQTLSVNHDIHARAAYSRPSYEFEPRNFSGFPGRMNVRAPSHPFSFGEGTSGRRKK